MLKSDRTLCPPLPFPLNIYLSDCLLVCLTACLFIYLSICLSVCLYVCLSVCPSVSLSVRLCLSVYLCICLSISVSYFCLLYVSLILTHLSPTRTFCLPIYISFSPLSLLYSIVSLLLFQSACLRVSSSLCLPTPLSPYLCFFVEHLRVISKLSPRLIRKH